MIRFIIELGKSKLILAFIALMGAVFGYLYVAEPDTSVLIIPSELSSKDGIQSLEGVRLDLSILDDVRYKRLEIFGENPVDPGVTGEVRNPFSDFA